MALKVLTPEVVYDSLVVVMSSTRTRQTDRERERQACERENASRSRAGLGQFVGAGVRPSSSVPTRDRDPTGVHPGHSPAPAADERPDAQPRRPVVDTLSQSEVNQTEAVDTLYLTALSRRPTPEETRLMSGYLSRRKDAREGYSGVLWILLNSSEFALNR